MSQTAQRPPAAPSRDERRRDGGRNEKSGRDDRPRKDETAAQFVTDYAPPAYGGSIADAVDVAADLWPGTGERREDGQPAAGPAHAFSGRRSANRTGPVPNGAPARPSSPPGRNRAPTNPPPPTGRSPTPGTSARRS